MTEQQLGIVDAAQRYATEAHAGQVREGSGLPYICHPARVVTTLRDVGMVDDEVLAAAWLHDVAEDTDRTIADIRELFGSRVADLVTMLTRVSGQDRADYYRTIWRDPTAEAIKLADRLDNLREVHLRGVAITRRYLAETFAHFDHTHTTSVAHRELWALLLRQDQTLRRWLRGGGPESHG